MTLTDLIGRASSGEALWVPDLREAFSHMPDAAALVLRLHRLDGSIEDRTLSLPVWKTDSEKQFAAEFLWAEVYNLLSVHSGQCLWFYYDQDNIPLVQLIDALPDVFMLHEQVRHGYGKVISIANRLCRAQGLPSFTFRSFSMDQYHPVSDKTASPDSPPPLSERLRKCQSAAEHLTLCGIDIGGTDIKLALSMDGRLICTREYDWNPALSRDAEGIIVPILQQVEKIRLQAASLLRSASAPLLDGIGISFPDIVIGDRILGGETPKTAGIRGNNALDYEQEFSKLSNLRNLLLPQCRRDAVIRVINDGNMAAFTAAVELSASAGHSHSDAVSRLQNGLLAHTLGTDLGTGWLFPDGSVPQIPLELYDLIIDLGSRPAAAYPQQDLRSTRNENSGLAGARRYLGQAAAFRIAHERDPELLAGFTEQTDGVLCLRTSPDDMRKPCLEHLMQIAAAGQPAAEAVFRQIGLNLGVIIRESDFLMQPSTRTRYLYGRFVKSEACFRLLREGCAVCAPDVELIAADESLANTSLMRQLAAREDVTVAQFGQAVGALYYAAAS